MLRKAAPLFRAVSTTASPSSLVFRQPGNSARLVRSSINANVFPHLRRQATRPMNPSWTVPSVFIPQSRSAATAAKESQAKLLVLYGSQTGTAETYSRQLANVAKTYGLQPHVCSLDEGLSLVKDDLPVSTPIVIVCSTYGNAEFPSNAKAFAAALKSGSLKVRDRPFAVLGFGNSNFPEFNKAAKQLHELLSSQGAKMMVPAEFSCEKAAVGHDAVFGPWKRKLWDALGCSSAQNVGAAVSFTVQPATGEASRLTPPGFMALPVESNVLLTPQQYDPPTSLLKLKVSAKVQQEMLGRPLACTDYVEVFPSNPPELVTRFLRRFSLDKNAVVRVQSLEASPEWFGQNTLTTVGALLSSVIDLNCFPTMSFCEFLAAVTPAPAEKALLTKLATDPTSYQQFRQTVCTLVDLVEQAPSLALTLPQILTTFPRISPRVYSVANAPVADGVVEIAYTVRTFQVGKAVHKGLATHALAACAAGQPLTVRLAAGHLQEPPLDAPLALLALGSGITPARAIIQSRLQARQAGKKIGQTLLYYGFRHADSDFLFKQEFTKYQTDGLIGLIDVASHDQEQFLTPMDKFDRRLQDLIHNGGHFIYSGHGGSVPLLIQKQFTKATGTDVAFLRHEKRYQEDCYSADATLEQTLTALYRSKGSFKTLAEKFASAPMFCYQCEQTQHGVGCTRVGVCGKTPDVAALQDLQVHMTKVLSFYLHELRQMGAADDIETNRFVLFALFMTLTNVNFDAPRFHESLETLRQKTVHFRKEYESLCRKQGKQPKVLELIHLPTPLPARKELVALGRAVGILSKYVDEDDQSTPGVTEMLVYGLKGIAAYFDHAVVNGKEDASLYAFMQEALSFLCFPHTLQETLAMCLKAGTANVSVLQLLYDSNKTLGTPSPAEVAVKPTPGKCILISGHDLIFMKSLLEACEPLGIKVYTHGEMLPAHGYPELRKFKCLAGHFGGAWNRQTVEFPHFPGSILMTTNCIIEPQASYKDRFFTLGAVGWPELKHLGNTLKDVNWKPLLEAALQSKGFTDADTEFSYPRHNYTTKFTVGFGHETVIGAAGTILDQVGKGNISHFYLVGGCDGYEGERAYYTQLVEKMPPTSVVLTLGCGKFRVNHLDMGTIGDTGIPRILDMGQCNDSFSAVQVAIALSQALKCQINDLPLTLVLSWFEQKAVAVLLSCLALGIKPIYVGPSLPAFLTPDVLKVLVENFGIRPVGDPETDLKAMSGAK